jgi:SAM-dependent methyltransferase
MSAKNGAAAALPLAHEYKEKAYWETRFSTETEHDWLCTFPQVRHLLGPYLGEPASSRILVLGNGNSSLPLELASAGFLCVTATDYVRGVVDAMSARHAGAPVSWAVADMLALEASGLPAGAFDVVIDKGAMDAIVSATGDSWSPPLEALSASLAVCRGVAALLAPGGKFLQISFSQPHFRAAHLLQGGGAPPPPPPPSPPPPPQEDEDKDEFEPDKNPGAAKPALPAVEGSLWARFEVLPVEAGLGYYLYALTKAIE